MKKCPQCQAAYYDETLVFCLEDGAKLQTLKSPVTAETKPFITDQKSIETVVLNDRGGIPKTLEVRDSATAVQKSADETKPLSLKQNAVEKGYRALEIGTIVLALAHNWWQWLYVERQNYGAVTDFLLSADFLIWVFLLLTGTAAGLLTIKFSRKKELGYAGLIVLAINFILLLVPRK